MTLRSDLARGTESFAVCGRVGKLTHRIRSGDNPTAVRSILAAVSIVLLAAGLFASPFVHAHSHSSHEHHGHESVAGTAVHAHLPETHQEPESSQERPGDDVHGEAIDLFLLVAEKAPAPIEPAPDPFFHSAPTWWVVGSVTTESPVRARDPASTFQPSRAPPADHSL